MSQAKSRPNTLVISTTKILVYMHSRALQFDLIVYTSPRCGCLGRRHASLLSHRKGLHRTHAARIRIVGIVYGFDVRSCTFLRVFCPRRMCGCCSLTSSMSPDGMLGQVQRNELAVTSPIVGIHRLSCMMLAAAFYCLCATD